MSINNLPVSVQQIVQDGWLLRFFNEALFPHLCYRGLFEAYPTMMHVGQSFTFTKKSLLPIVQNALAPASNTDLTSGLSPAQQTYEQYSMTMKQIAAYVPMNMLSSGIAIVDLFKEAAKDLGQNAGLSLEVQARRALFTAYSGGRTYVTANVVTSTALPVQNVNGFDFVYVNGVRQATSVTNPHPVTLNGIANTITAVTPGTLNVNDDSLPGTLTAGTSVSLTSGQAVVSNFAPVSVRPNGKTTSAALISTDVANLNLFMQAGAALRKAAVPTHKDGFYRAVISPDTTVSLMNDPAFQRVYDTHADSEELMRGLIGMIGGIKLYESQLTPASANPAGLTVQRAIVTGDTMGYEGQFEGIARWLEVSGTSATGTVVFSPEAHVAMILRTPLDVLQQVNSQAWSFIGDWVVATDALSTFGGASYYKRGVLVEHI